MDSREKTNSLGPSIYIDRLPLTVQDRQQIYSYDGLHSTGAKRKFAMKLKAKVKCSKQGYLKHLYEKLPILTWIIGYDFKNWFIGDLVAGITVAIMHIPQGMGFALLAHVPAITGIYMAFYQSLIYAIFATSKHNSMGTFAVITLMTGKVVKELATFPMENSSGETPLNDSILSTNTIVNLTDTSDSSTIGHYTPIQVATIVCFMVGIWHMIFGALRLGKLACFLSEMLVSGFTTAAAVHVLTSQMKDLLGIKIPGFSGPFKIIYTYIAIFTNLPTVNRAAILVTFISIVVLVVNNEVLKPIVSKYSKIPVPIELIAVAVGTGVSFLVKAEQEYNVEVIGNIPTGLPPPAVPPMDLIGKVAADTFVIAIVAYTVNFSLAKIFASKHGYVVDATQELYANGITNIFSSFFSCAPTASALARTLIQDSVGGVTQMASLIVCSIILLVLLFIGPIFETLPKAVLASIIVVALKGMFMQVKDMLNMWTRSKVDAMTWIVTFFAVVIIDIDFGLLIGVIFSLIVLLSQNQTPLVSTLGRVHGTDVYLDVLRYSQAKEIPCVKILKLTGTIHFANAEKLYSIIKKKLNLDEKTQNYLDKNEQIENVQHDMTKIRVAILDFGAVCQVDSTGGKLLKILKDKCLDCEVSMCLAGLTDEVIDTLKKLDVSFSNEIVFHSVHDAIVGLELDTSGLNNTM